MAREKKTNKNKKKKIARGKELEKKEKKNAHQNGFSRVQNGQILGLNRKGRLGGIEAAKTFEDGDFSSFL